MASFEELNARKYARILTGEVYRVCNDLKDWGFRDQICRASVSIMNNVAEGYERETELDRKKFMVIAKSSSAEVRSMIFLALDLGYIDENTHQRLLIQIQDIGKLLYGMIKKMSG